MAADAAGGTLARGDRALDAGDLRPAPGRSLRGRPHRALHCAAGDAPSQDCRRLLDPDLPEDLRFTRAGQHFIVFVDMPGKVIVVDVLHSRSDLPRRLAALGPAKDPEKH